MKKGSSKYSSPEEKREAAKARSRKFYENNKARILAKEKAKREVDPEGTKAAYAAWKAKTGHTSTASTAKWRRENPEAAKVTRRRELDRNKAKRRERGLRRGGPPARPLEERLIRRKKSQEEWHRNNPNYKKDYYLKVRERVLEKRLIRLYGLTVRQRDEMYERQQGKCLICMKGFRKLNVDHEHSTGRVRGLLCARCNTAVGWYETTLPIRDAVVEYVERNGGR